MRKMECERAYSVDYCQLHQPVRPRTVCVACEVPVEIKYNGIYYAIMMMTPANLEGFARGFSLTEGIITTLKAIKSIDVIQGEGGFSVNIGVDSVSLREVLNRRKRNIPAASACGICGADESLFDEDVPHVQSVTPSLEAIFNALARIKDAQKMNKKVHMLHASAWCGLDGSIQCLREDIGRHNSLDKLIGACGEEKLSGPSGFCLITSRCSFEMVKKALVAKMGCLVAISGASSRAIRMAKRAGLVLFFKVKKDAILKVSS